MVHLKFKTNRFEKGQAYKSLLLNLLFYRFVRYAQDFTYLKMWFFNNQENESHIIISISAILFDIRGPLTMIVKKITVNFLLLFCGHCMYPEK